MSNISPIKEGFENPKAFLMKIAEDEEIERLVIVVQLKDGTMFPSHLKCNKGDLAFAGAMLTQWALEDQS